MSGESVYQLVDAVEAAREQSRVEREEPWLLDERPQFGVEVERPSSADLAEESR